jgi:DNA-binding CsgD family transcriptional regulator
MTAFMAAWHTAISALTPRERHVLQLAARDFSAPEIALRLGIADATVRTHFANLYRKLGVRSRCAAVAVGIRSGLIS